MAGGRFSRRWCWLGTLAGLGLVALLVGMVGALSASADRAGTVTVTNTNDSGPGSLRQAIADAQPGDTVEFALGLPATITLTSGGLSITKPLTIAGPGPELLAVSGNDASRVFRVHKPRGATQMAVSLSGLTIRDGNVVHFGDGGGLWNDQDLILADVAFHSNVAERGGAMYNAGGSATLTNVSFHGNRASQKGGGMYNGCQSSPTLTNVTLGGNWAGQQGGGMYNESSSSPTIHNSVLWGNRAASGGDQIHNSSSSTPTIAHSDIEGSGGSGPDWDMSLGIDGGGNLDADPEFREPVDPYDPPRATGDVRLLWFSPAVDAGNNDLVPAGVSTDLDGKPRIAHGRVDMGAHELQPGFHLHKAAGHDWAAPGERVVYTIRAANTFTDTAMTGAVILDALPGGLDFAGPITLDPPGAGTPGTAPPILASELTIQAGQEVTVSLPVTLQMGAAPGASIANTAAISSAQVPSPWLAAHVLGVCLSYHVAVTSEADYGPGSLRWAIADVCPGGSIEFALSYPTTITLSGGQLTIRQPLTIDGPGPELLAVSGNGASRVFRVDEPTRFQQTSVTLSGLTIRNGEAGSENGGGLWNSIATLTLTDVAFRGNSTDSRGGGMYNDYGSSSTLANVVFQGNSATYNGGGMYNAHGSSPWLTEVTLDGNRADWGGGGMYNAYGSSPTLANVTFAGNWANWGGGGMYNVYASSPRLTNVTFAGNWTDWGGGGMYNGYGSNPSLTNVRFEGNSAVWEGGGVLNYGSSPTLTNVSFSGNAANWDGGGMCNSWYSSPTLTNVSFSGNTAIGAGGGMYNDGSSPRIRNSILWGNRAASGGYQVDNYDSSPTIAYSDVEGSGGSGAGWDAGLGIDLGGNLDVDPLFVEPVDPATAPTTAENLRLGQGSPAIDAGDNGLLPAGVVTDLDGKPRILFGIVDMGAYEFGVRVYLPLLVRGTRRE
jgi:uncharacterized repeat protein (TIGR01451 family)